MSDLIWGAIAGAALNKILSQPERLSAQEQINNVFSEWSDNRQELYTLGDNNYNALPLESVLHEFATEKAGGSIDQDNLDQITNAVGNKEFAKLVDLNSRFLARTDFSGYNLKGTDFSNSNFTGANFSEQSFELQSLQDNVFDEANFSNVIIRNTSFAGSSFVNSNFSDTVEYSGRGLYSVNLQDCNLSGANFLGVDLFAVDFRGADLTDTKFEGVTFSNSGIGDVQMDINSLQDANFTNARGMENITFYTEDGKEIIGLDWIDGNPVPSQGLSANFASASDYIDNNFTPSDNKILFSDTDFWEQNGGGEIAADLNARLPQSNLTREL